MDAADGAESGDGLPRPVEPKSPGNLAGKIALVKLPEIPGTSITPGNLVHQMIEPIQEAGPIAIVAITQAPSGDIVELNAMSGPAKWTVPIMIVGQKR